MPEVDERRLRSIKKGELKPGPVIYWMQRDQRAHDNWALLHAQEEAKKSNSPVCVVFCLVSSFGKAPMRAYDFMLKGLQAVEKELNKYKIPFVMLKGTPEVEIPKFLKKSQAGLLVTDFSPLKLPKKWKAQVGKKVAIPFVEVDAHNIIPCWHASIKQEFAARTFRPKVEKQLKAFLTPFPKLAKQSKTIPNLPKHSWDSLERFLEVDKTIRPVDWIKPGEGAAEQMLKTFLSKGLSRYSKERNDPNKQAVSNLSPYLHFGQISAQRVALEVKKRGPSSANVAAFLEELIVRRELSDNYCFYNTNYDSPKGFPEWAKKTLHKHAKDKRSHLYTRRQLEQAKTDDPLWNAAQLEMVIKGKMHGFMRMYWAKKILEWTPTVEQAMKIALDLNDRYELDGRDPNGYVGIAWSLGGVHDRPWGERSVFGLIRTMTDKGCRSKFDTEAYIKAVEELTKTPNNC